MRLKEPFVLARTAQGRTLVVTGPWTSAAASLLSRGEVDGLTLNYALGFCESDLSFFGEWPIRRLQILDRLLVDLSPIERLSPSLEDLSVQVAPEARLNLAGFWNLRKLSGDWQLLRLALGQVQSLETLITWNFDEANLLPLIEHSRLETLTIKDAPRLQTLRGIRTLKSTSVLGFCTARQLWDISDLTGSARTLQELRFENCTRIGAIDALNGLTGLRHLEMNDCRRIKSFEPIRDLPELEVLHARGSTRIVDRNLSLLLRLPRLRELRMKSRIEYRPSVDEVKTAIHSE
jgi:hypothetical protein